MLVVFSLFGCLLAVRCVEVYFQIYLSVYGRFDVMVWYADSSIKNMFSSAQAYLPSTLLYRVGAAGYAPTVIRPSSLADCRSWHLMYTLLKKINGWFSWINQTISFSLYSVFTYFYWHFYVSPVSASSVLLNKEKFASYSVLLFLTQTMERWAYFTSIALVLTVLNSALYLLLDLQVQVN